MTSIAIFFVAALAWAGPQRVELSGAQALTLSRILQKYDIGNSAGGHFNVNLRYLSCTGPNDIDAHLKIEIVCNLKGFNSLDKTHSTTLSGSNRSNNGDAAALFTLLKNTTNPLTSFHPRVRTIPVRQVHCEGVTSTDTSPRCRFEF